MAKKPVKRRRSRGKYVKGSIDETIGLGTLAANDVIGADNSQVTTEKTRVSSVVCTYAIDKIGESQGPLIFGVAHSDYTDAEIEQVIENTGSWNSGDKVQQEVAGRLVRILGQFVSQQATGSDTDIKFNEGRPMKTKLNWMLNTGQTLRWWVYNASDAALVTSAPDFLVNGHANLWVQ